MREPLLWVHSWTRWGVLISLVYLCITYGGHALRGRRNWTPRDQGLLWAFEQVYGYQILFALTLWLSANPWVKVAIQTRGAALSTPVVGFFALVHPLTMLLGFAAFQFGKSRIRAAEHQDRRQIFFRVLLLVLVLVVAFIPWPFVTYGRELFRWEF